MHKVALSSKAPKLPPARLICPQLSPSVQESFLFHSSLCEAQSPSRLFPSFSFVLLSCVWRCSCPLDGWSLLPAFNKCSVKLFCLCIYCCICGRKWLHVPLLSHLSHISILKCTHSRVCVVLLNEKDSMIHPFPHFQQIICLALPFQFCFYCILFFRLQTAVTISYLLSLSSLNPGLYPFVFSFLQFFHYQLLCLQYQKSLILDVRTIEKITRWFLLQFLWH